MASPGLSPWTVSIRNSFDFHNCGGGIVSARWVLTTAHCLASRLPSNTMIVAGSNRLDSGGQSYRGSRIVIHPSYNSNTLAHDMGLVETSTPIIFSNLVQRLTVGRNEVGGGVWASFAGWGWTSVSSW
jgi:secreted trypsin-like serine protease